MLHIPFVRILKRENTGVGLYVNFIYETGIANLDPIIPSNSAISTNELIKMEPLIRGLGYELNITNGKIDFLELVTYDEEWNGAINSFSFV